MGEPNAWGRMIIDLRTEQGLSQRQLAKGAAVNRSTLRRIEEGESDGEVTVIERCLRYLGYELDAFLIGSMHDRMKVHIDEADDPATRSKLAATRLLLVRPQDLTDK